MRYAVYLNEVPGRMSNPWCLAYIISSGAPGSEQKSQIDTENVAYDLTLTYGTYTSFKRLYSFQINVYGRSYFTGTTNQGLDKQIRRAKHAI